jgi:hypothetical protein
LRASERALLLAERRVRRKWIVVAANRHKHEREE